MRKLLPLLVVLASASGFAFDPIPLVDPFIGTAGEGHVSPGPTTPFGMLQWGPDTPGHSTSSYDYRANEIQGFSLTHLSGTGCPNSAEFPILPTIGQGNVTNRIGFSHRGEIATPDYYRVPLSNGVQVELTATPRSGMARFQYPAAEFSNLLLDAAAGTLAGEWHATGTRELTGWARNGRFCGSAAEYTIYVVARTDRDFRLTSSSNAKALLSFDTRQDATVRLKVAISYVSIENARSNLDAENPDWNFDRLHQVGESAWRKKLSAIEITGGSPSQQKLFYTALYHSLLHPNVFSDENGDYIGFDNKVHQAVGRNHYANFSGWDIYRSQLQLVTWLFPDIGSGIAASLVEDAAECGALPKWSLNNTETGVMIGDPGPAALASIFAFGGKSFDTTSALRFMLKNGLDNSAQCNGSSARPAGELYQRLGYVPAPSNLVWGPVSATLEYAIADFSIAMFARAKNDLASTQSFSARAGSWQNLFHSPSGLLRARDTVGNWVNGVDENTGDNYVEGNAAQYLWLVPQNPRLLIEKLGGDAVAIARLDRLFQQLNANTGLPYFYIGNENNFATPWMYLWAHAPAKTQDVVRRILDETFLPSVSGLPGNDDLGATSSWYVWSALGLYPSMPGVGGLAVTSPLFSHIFIRGENQHPVEISAAQAPHRYISSLTLNGRTQTRPWLDAKFVAEGGKLEFTLLDRPTVWGSADLPPSPEELLQ